ncbi:uncharacterized protein [Venturia canescens]|uniref:uncharacterized protein n=1 Tax=Venturia canescens TaxID=32260 RepID=UPI001C9C9CCD|nr:uncharacterized protein LOC122409513 [Venturia canescens]
MDPIVHLWNLSKFFENTRNPDIIKLRMHYKQCCQKLNRNYELPKQNFGQSTMCPQCCTPWSMVKYKSRILPGKTMSKRIEKLMKFPADATSRNSSRTHSLVSKCKKNTSNKLIRICSVCSRTTTFSLSKPRREKISEKNSFVSLNVSTSSKKRKKRTKDRTAGLNLSDSQTPETKRFSNLQTIIPKTPASCNSKSKLLQAKTSTPTSSKKLNLVKLKGIMNAGTTPSKKNKLHSFLQEFC